MRCKIAITNAESLSQNSVRISYISYLIAIYNNSPIFARRFLT